MSQRIPVRVNGRTTGAPAERVLRPADRCDACGAAQAFVRVKLREERQLDFCKHHYERHAAALDGHPAVVDIVDERAFINSKPSPST